VTRQRIVQKGPRKDLQGFPARRFGGSFYRAARQAPWWFCRCGGCRFDVLNTTDPLVGTLYVGTDVLTGVMEVIGPELLGRTIGIRHLRDRALWQLAYDRALELADTCHSKAVAFGVTNELATMVPYDIPQQWALAFNEAEWDGISYRTRFMTGPSATGLALFDAAGSHADWISQDLGSAADDDIISDLLAVGVEVLMTAPHSSEFEELS